jgi:hypothetical protein
MATVHPSRMALVPQDTKDVYADRKRTRSPPRRHSRSRSRSRERDSRRNRSHHDSKGRRRNGSSDGSRDRGRDGDTSRNTERRERSRERNGDNGFSRRRVSPVYPDYRKPSPPPPREDSQAPWRQQENMYPSRRDRDRPYGGSGGSDFMER